MKAVGAVDFPDLDLDEEEVNSEPVDASDLDNVSNEEDGNSNPDRCIKKNTMGYTYFVKFADVFFFLCLCSVVVGGGGGF